ncbi:hypothetical protein FBY04_14614 [Pseudomonas sp. SJZ080]|nr:hypothetical protein FBY04_14614 [Pseudomonas sp. SJZ080]
MVLTLFLPLALLAGCQSTKDQLLAQGYPPVFASGFNDGCVSGRQATGTIGEFRKNVPVYLQDRQYATAGMMAFANARSVQAAISTTR